VLTVDGQPWASLVLGSCGNASCLWPALLPGAAVQPGLDRQQQCACCRLCQAQNDAAAAAVSAGALDVKL
jgi:hypothetical protein